MRGSLAVTQQQGEYYQQGALPVVSPELEDASQNDDDDPDGIVAGANLLARMDLMIDNLPCCARAVCLPCARFLASDRPGYKSLGGLARGLFGPLLYGALFAPFVFALLQESATNRIAVNPYGTDITLSRRAWLAGFVFLAAVFLYIIVAFSALPEAWYQPGSPRLAMLIGAVILVVWLQQALTVRYILLRPDLAKLSKNRKTKFKLCGNAYSTLNPRRLINYIFMSVVISEFLLLTSVCFHESVPWEISGTRSSGGDNNLVRALQQILPQALVGALASGQNVLLLGVMMIVVSTYMILLGVMVYDRMPPRHVVTALTADFFAGTFYTTIVGRLLLSANNLPADSRAGRVFAMICVFGFSTTAIFVASMRGDAGMRKNTKRRPPADVRFLPKWVAMERILKGTVGIFAALLGNLRLNERSDDEIDGGVVLPPASPPEADDNFVTAILRPRLGAILLLGFAIVVTIAHLVLLQVWHPTCSVTFVTRARTALLGVALVGQFITLSMMLMPWEGWFVVLIVIWSLAFFVLLLRAVYVVFFKPVSGDEPEEMRQRRQRDAEDKKLKQKTTRKRRGARGTTVALNVGRGAVPPPPAQAENMSILRPPPEGI